MALDTSDLIFKNAVVESRLEFALASGRRRDVHGSLTTAENDKVLFGRDGGRVEGCVGDEGLEDVESAGADDFGGLVLGGGDEVEAVFGELKIGDLHVELVSLDVVELFAGLSCGLELKMPQRIFRLLETYLRIVLADAAVLVSCNDVFAQVTPSCNRRLAFRALNL